ncbi:hypothetical protein WBG99_12825 [Streptomyces sp. TG1A-60]|uniref:hypothetical protein n=1 Tax=Streptomyces sp. TG1A-60 TaxID=3129111 RepID=UPI0030D24BE0
MQEVDVLPVDLEEASPRALTKPEQMLPSRLRHRVTTLHTATVRAGAAPAPKVAPDTLMAIAEPAAVANASAFLPGLPGVRAQEAR